MKKNVLMGIAIAWAMGLAWKSLWQNNMGSITSNTSKEWITALNTNIPDEYMYISKGTVYLFWCEAPKNYVKDGETHSFGDLNDVKFFPGGISVGIGDHVYTNIWWKLQLIKWSDASTFRSIGWHRYADGNNLYYHNKAIKWENPNDFSVIPVGSNDDTYCNKFGKGKNWVYAYGKLVNWIDQETIVPIIENGWIVWFQDKNGSYDLDFRVKTQN
jgi:hypothetical protein